MKLGKTMRLFETSLLKTVKEHFYPTMTVGNGKKIFLKMVLSAAT